MHGGAIARRRRVNSRLTSSTQCDSGSIRVTPLLGFALTGLNADLVAPSIYGQLLAPQPRAPDVFFVAI